MKIINRTVWILSFVSLFADMASEMLYPVIPIYLQEIGFSVLLIGILEGFAEFTAGISKGYFGHMSDRRGLRLPFIRLGYLLSALSKPMMAFFTIPVWIFFSRSVDRLGKGLRTAARDALLSQNATIETKARVFGLHRGMDTLGAVTGPLIALFFLYYLPGNYITLFYIAFVPGLISVLLIYFLSEKKNPSSTLSSRHFLSFFGYWRIAPVAFKRLVPGLLLFAAVNSSDVFLLLKLKEITGSDTITIAAYIFYNLVYAVLSYPLGMLADRLNFKSIVLSGLLIFAVVYFLFGLGTSPWILYVALFLYGMYAAATEGVIKAWITNLAHHQNTATAVGFYTTCQSICSLLASVTAGVMWYNFNSTTMFLLTGIVSLIVFFYLLAFTERVKINKI